MKAVCHTLETLAKLTASRSRELENLAALPDSLIGTSDIPELTDAQMSDAVRGRFYRPIKQQITARLDADILAWLNADGRGYQTRLNTILRQVMQREQAGKIRKSG